MSSLRRLASPDFAALASSLNAAAAASSTAFRRASAAAASSNASWMWTSVSSHSAASGLVMTGSTIFRIFSRSV